MREIVEPSSAEQPGSQQCGRRGSQATAIGKLGRKETAIPCQREVTHVRIARSSPQ